MEMSGEKTIAAPRQTVWEKLNDAETLKACIPGCQSLDWTGDDSLSGAVKAKVGPVNATFKGDVTLSDLDPPTSYTISGQGKGGAAGFAKGSADIHLAEAEDGAATVLTYQVKASVGGKLAQVGSRLVDSTARKYADEFFAEFDRLVGSGEAAASAPAPTSPTEPAAGPATAPAPAPADAAPQRPSPAHQKVAGLPLPIWLSGLTVAILVLLGWLVFGA